MLMASTAWNRELLNMVKSMYFMYSICLILLKFLDVYYMYIVNVFQSISVFTSLKSLSSWSLGQQDNFCLGGLCNSNKF